ncbi:hypothetical protein [Sphingomonas sp. R1]|uniref:hypothetical protein n=1 Tax=Sphingomonas sp. R1 TaxID=399176 RepID=UPI0022241767|nr:hypothetical protein [Sphingomonas sp. R1]UYY77516.1 hypothetical protein OIM94_00435 [Sphingomonas sp. R1]
MTDPFPFKFNVSTVEYETVVEWLRNFPSERYRIATREMKGELTLEEWRSVKIIEAQKDAERAGDDHHVTDPDEREALLRSDSHEKVEIVHCGLLTTASRRLLNRIAIQGGVNEAGIVRENWSAAFSRGVQSYMVQFRDRDDAVMFKLAMWRRPGDDARP